MKSSVFVSLLLFAFLTPVVNANPLSVLPNVRNKAQTLSGANNLKQILLTITLYAQENDGKLPVDAGAAGLDILREYGSLPGTLFLLPGDRSAVAATGKLTEKNTSIAYLGSAISRLDTLRNPAVIPLLLEKPGHRAAIILVGFADGHVETLSQDSGNCEEAIAHLRKAASNQEDPLWGKLSAAAKAIDKTEENRAKN